MTVPYLALEHPIRLAHRGSRVLWPENTMEAFAGAVGLGYRYLETDVAMTRDGVVVLSHDPTLDRLTNGRGNIADWDWEDLRVLDAAWAFGADDGHPLRSTGVHIPRLDDVFAAWPDVHVNLDLKVSGAEWAVAEVIARSERSDMVLVGSFRDARIARFRRITQGSVATSAGTRAAVAAWAGSRRGRFPRQPHVAYQLPYRVRGMQLDARFVDAAHAAGAQVHAWTVNEPHDMRRVLDIGVDGIVTDRPDLLNEVLEGRGDTT